MHDYSGPLREDFSLAQLDRKTLARYGREVMLANQIHDRCVMPIVGARWDHNAITRTAIDEWMGSSPIYNARNRAMHNIAGDGVDVIMKGFQLDIGAPHMWLRFHYDVVDRDFGYFWLTFCGAFHHVHKLTGADAAMETQICHHMEDPTFDATVMAVNSGARCRPVFRPPHGENIPDAGPCRWEVSIDRSRIGAVEENAITPIVRGSRAAQFRFAAAEPADVGLADYSGPFKRDFRLEDFCHGTLLRQVKEFALDVHLLQRACYTSLAGRYGTDMLPELIAEHWAAMAPLYQARNRRLFNIEGEDTTAVLKLLQLDHHFVPEYVNTGVKLLDERNGLFWIGDCEAIGDGETSGVLTCLLRGETSGLQQAVQSANPRARVTAIDPAGIEGAVLAFAIEIDPEREPAQPSPYSELAGMNGLLEADLSEHVYEYER